MSLGRYVERHPLWSLVFLAVGGMVLADLVRAARGTPKTIVQGGGDGGPTALPAEGRIT